MDAKEMKEDPTTKNFVQVLNEIGFAAEQRQMTNGRGNIPLLYTTSPNSLRKWWGKLEGIFSKV